MIRRIDAALILAGAVGLAACSTRAPERPAPERVRKTLSELSPDEARRVRDRDDNDAICLRGDHEFLICGGEQVGRLYESALGRNPNHIRANLGMGEWLVLHGYYRDAVPYLTRVTQHAARDSPEYNQAKQALEYAEFQDRQEKRANHRWQPSGGSGRS
jgi:hypothetical protein